MESYRTGSASASVFKVPQSFGESGATAYPNIEECINQVTKTRELLITIHDKLTANIAQMTGHLPEAGENATPETPMPEGSIAILHRHIIKLQADVERLQYPLRLSERL